MLSIGCAAYIGSGIIIIINDYSIECKVSYLSVYLIVSLILFFKGAINLWLRIYNFEPLKIFINLLCQLIVDLVLSVWGI